MKATHMVGVKHKVTTWNLTLYNPETKAIFSQDASKIPIKNLCYQLQICVYPGEL